MTYQDRNSPKDLHHLLFSRYTFVIYLQLYHELSSVGLIILCFASTTKSESLITTTSERGAECGRSEKFKTKRIFNRRTYNECIRCLALLYFVLSMSTISTNAILGQ